MLSEARRLLLAPDASSEASRLFTPPLPKRPRSGVALRSEATAFRARPGLLPPMLKSEASSLPYLPNERPELKKCEHQCERPSRSSVVKALWPKRDQIFKTETMVDCGKIFASVCD
jgi:hypothetical protein